MNAQCQFIKTEREAFKEVFESPVRAISRKGLCSLLRRVAEKRNYRVSVLDFVGILIKYKRRTHLK